MAVHQRSNQGLESAETTLGRVRSPRLVANLVLAWLVADLETSAGPHQCPGCGLQGPPGWEQVGSACT